METTENIITDQALVAAVEVYLQISNWSRQEFIEDLQQLSEQVATQRFEGFLKGGSHAVDHR